MSPPPPHRTYPPPPHRTCILTIGAMTTEFLFYNVCLVVEEAYDDVGVAFGVQFPVSPRPMTNVSKSLFLI